MQAVRNNNDLEEWHRRLNKRAVGGQVPLYVLEPRLHREAKLLSNQMKLVSEDKLSRYHRRQYKTQQVHLFSMRESFTDNELTTAQLLSKCASVFGPTL